MSAAVSDVPNAPPRRGKRRLLMIVGVLVLLVLLGAGAAAYVLHQRAAAAAAEDEDESAEETEKPAAKHDPKAVPIFLPLDVFTVNLADRDAERYAQVGVTLELDEEQSVERLKAYMPAIRNNVLLVLAQKTSTELLDRAGKGKLAAEIRREAVRPLGIEIDEANGAAHAESDDAKPNKRKKTHAGAAVPVTQVHFSSFIIQ